MDAQPQNTGEKTLVTPNQTIMQLTSSAATGSEKKNIWGFELKARWKGFTEVEDTWEPITNQAKYNPALVKSVLMKISAEEADPLNQL